MRNWVFCSAFIYTALHRVESEVPCKGEYWSKIGSSARDKTKRRGDLGKWMTLIPQTRVGNGARDTQWQLELEPVLTQLYSQQVYTQVHKKDLKQTELSYQVQTLQGCKQACGGTPWHRRHQCLSHFKKNCWVFLAPKQLRAKVTEVKHRGFCLFSKVKKEEVTENYKIWMGPDNTW